MQPFNKLHNHPEKYFFLLLTILGFIKQISSPSPDIELVEAYRSMGNLVQLGELYQRYMELVYGVCLKYLKEPEDAQDAVMIIFEELVTKLQKHPVDNFKSWLYTLAKNHCLMRLRSLKRMPTVKMAGEFMQSSEDGHLEDVLAREDNFKQLDYCLGQLTTEQRKVIELFYLQDKCYNEITAETGLEWNTVRSFIQNGRRNLRLCMESQQKKTVV